jgi:DNA-binding FrmR family transcriptional regulator
MAAAPLNIQHIRGHVQGIADELQNAPQPPPPQEPIQQQLAAIQAQIAALQGQVDNLGNQLDNAVLSIQTR